MSCEGVDETRARQKGITQGGWTEIAIICGFLRRRWYGRKMEGRPEAATIWPAGCGSER